MCGNKGKLVCLYISNAMVYSFNALFYCFLPIYFNGMFSPIEAGILLSVGPAVSIIAPLFWGMIADRAKYKNTVLIVSILCSAVSFFCLRYDLGFLGMALLVGVTMLFMSPFPGLIDAITLEHAEAAHTPYGPIRVMGTLGFGIITLISTLISDGDMGAVAWLYAGMALLCSLALLIGPKVEGHARSEKKRETKGKKDLRSLLCCRQLMLMIFCIFVLQFAYSFYINYFPTYMTETLSLPQWSWGVNMLLTVFMEIPFFFLYNRLFRKVGIRSLLMFSMAGSVVRCILLAVCKSVTAIFIVNTITGFLVTVVTYCAATYITKYIAPELQATAQNLIYCIGQSIARVLGGVCGGVIQTKLGTSYGMLLFGAIILLSTVIYYFTLHRDPSPMLGPQKD